MKYIPIFFIFLFVIAYLYFADTNEYIGPRYDVKPRKALDELGKKIAKQNGMTLLRRAAYGGGSRTVKAMWVLHFTSNKNMTIGEAKPLAIDIARQMLDKMYGDPLFKEYVRIEHEEYPKTSSELSDDMVGFKIAYWDDNMDRPLYPYLAEVRFTEGQLKFFYANKNTQALEQPIVEPFKKSL